MEKTENIIEFKEEEEVLQELKSFLGDALLDSKIPKKRRVFIDIPSQKLRDVLTFLNEKYEICFLHTITAVDTMENFELLYHLFIGEKKVTLNLRIKISRENPKTSTITDIMPAANLYEREIHDLFGIVFEGHPHPERVILPDDWPEGVYPLRKDFKMGEKNGK